MKRILAVGILAAAMAGTAQAQLMAAGSNFTGPGGGGAGTSGTIGAYIPNVGGSFIYSSTGMPSAGEASGFSRATGPANVTVGGVTVSIDAESQAAAALAVTDGNSVPFLGSLGTAVPGPAAQALAQALVSLGMHARAGNNALFTAALASAVDAFNAAINAMAPGTAVPQSLIAARAIIAGYYSPQTS